MQPLFSIIVPIYKVELYLKECIESLLAQTYGNFELILVDDGSPDNSPAICDSYAEKDKRILVVHKENGGVVSARNEGCRVATGEYVCCIDGDDWVSPDYLEAFATVIIAQKPDVVCNGYVRAYEDRQKAVKLPHRFGYYDKKQIENEIFPFLIASENLSVFMPMVWGKAIKRELFVPRQLAVSPENKIGEDGACSRACLYSAESLYVLDGCTYFYRQTPTGAMSRKRVYSWKDPKLVATYLKDQIDISQFDFQEQLYRIVLHELFWVTVSQFNRQESYRVIVNDIKKQIKEPIYRQAISRCRFKRRMGKIAVFAFRYKLFFLFALWNRIKR